MPTKTWKQFERDVGSWFGVLRNALSGRNNRNDDGTPRLGDIVYNHAVIECKLYGKNVVISRAKETAKLAKEYNKPWAHFERLNGDKGIIIVALDEDVMRDVVVPALRRHWENEGEHCDPECVCHLECSREPTEPDHSWRD